MFLVQFFLKINAGARKKTNKPLKNKHSTSQTKIAKCDGQEAFASLCIRARVHKNKSRQLHTMGSATAEFEVRHRWRTTTLFSGRYALNAEHVHARSLQKLHLFDWHFRLGLHFACTCSSKYSVHRWVQRSRINVFSVFSTDWRWQWWRTSNSAVAAFIAKRPRVAYSCSYVLLIRVPSTAPLMKNSSFLTGHRLAVQRKKQQHRMSTWSLLPLFRDCSPSLQTVAVSADSPTWRTNMRKRVIERW